MTASKTVNREIERPIHMTQGEACCSVICSRACQLMNSSGGCAFTCRNNRRVLPDPYGGFFLPGCQTSAPSQMDGPVSERDRQALETACPSAQTFLS